MSGLFKRFSGRRSAGPEGSEPPTAAEQGTADAPATPTAESGGHQSLLTDPAAPTRVPREGEQPAGPGPDPDVRTRVLREGEQPAGPRPDPDVRTRVLREGEQPAAAEPAADPNAHTVFGVPAPAPAEPAPFYGPAPGPNAPAPFAQPVPPPVRVEPVADLPAGLDPDELAAAPGTSARRGKLRRRIAFLRAARELLLRDLGGFVYELHRTAHDIEHEAHRRLRETKLARLGRVDAELHELELRLDDVRRQVLVREPGVGGECPHCGELYASAAHYCSNCGNPLTESARRELAKAQAPVAEPVAAAEPQPEAATPPVAAVDQPTQEIPPLDPDHPSAEPDFKWPSRDTGAAAASSGIDLRKADTTGAGAGGATPDETPVGGADAPAAGSTPDETPVGETGADAHAAEQATPAPVGETGADAPAAAEAPAPDAEAATPDEPTGDAGTDAPVADTATPDEATHADDVARSPADGESGTRSAATDAEVTRELTSGDPLEARNGSAPDDSVLRPVERRQ